MKAVLQTIRTELDEKTGCSGATETERDPGVMQSVEEHQEIPKGEAAVMPVGEPRKRHRVCNLAVACRKVSRRAKVAWRKRKLDRRIQTQRKYGAKKRLTVTGRKTTSHATVAWRSENVVKDCTRDQAKRGAHNKFFIALPPNTRQYYTSSPFS
jgi:hypothetical protein